MLSRFREKNIKVKLGKCQLFSTSVEYLGHTILASGIKPSEKRQEAILKCPAPQNVNQLRSFIGMTMYYQKHVPHLTSHHNFYMNY